jgi:hypothetical protein
LLENNIKYYKKISDEALINLSENKKYKFTVNEKLLNDNISNFLKIDDSTASKELIDKYKKDMHKMINTANIEYNKVLNKLNSTQYNISNFLKDDKVLKQKILNDYVDTGVIGFKAKNGARWNIETYSNMYTRHVNNECVRNSVLEQSKKQGKEKIKISIHGTKCDLCKPWEDKILTFEELETAKSAGLFHPNCLHIVLFVVERIKF